MDKVIQCWEVSSRLSWDFWVTMSKDKHEEVPSPPALDGVDWRERCLSLETSLQQFKHQVARIRETLGEKVGKSKFDYIFLKLLHFHILKINWEYMWHALISQSGLWMVAINGPWKILWLWMWLLIIKLLLCVCHFTLYTNNLANMDY